MPYEEPYAGEDGTRIALPRPNRLPRYRLFVGPPPADDRVFYRNIWSQGRNSPQAEGLVPRLSRLDCYFATCSGHRIPRAVQFRALRATSGLRDRVVVGAAGKRYRWMLANSPEQLALFPGRVVAQIDDPTFSRRETELLSLDNVAVVSLTAESAVSRFRSLGVEKPCYVLPLGSEVETLTEASVSAVRRNHRREGEVVIGYIAATLRVEGDRRADNPLYSIEHLLHLWEEIRAAEPSARLWLIGDASSRLRRRVAGRSDIALFGRVPRERSLAYVANFDIALYPRTADQGVRASKIADYMGAGVATVSYDYEVVDDLREARAGLLATTPAEFVAAAVQLARDEPLRRRLAEAARREGLKRDWRVLAPRFEREVLDRYLC